MSSLSRLKKLHLIKRNKSWLSSPLSPGLKFGYYGFLVLAMGRSAVGMKKVVNYLGRKLYYDNMATPLSLQAYPHEISRKIIDNLDGAPIRRVLDIGGNIGQFSLTLDHMLRGRADIDVLEPNPEAYALLKINTSSSDNIRIYNCGVGEPNITHMFFTPGQSATGSVYKPNISQQAKAKKIEISLVDDIAKLTSHRSYDLTKIDVEGFEFQVIEHLKPFKTKFLFIEISGLGRYKDFSHSELLAAVSEKFGKFDILHLTAYEAGDDNFDALFKFV